MASLFHIHQGFFVLPGIPHQGGDVSAEFIRDVLGLPAKFHLCCGSANIKIDLLNQCLQVKVASLNLHSLRKYAFVVTACYVVKLFGFFVFFFSQAEMKSQHTRILCINYAFKVLWPVLQQWILHGHLRSTAAESQISDPQISTKSFN